MTAPVLSLVGLEKRFGALQVTRGVSLAVHPGEVHALIGPNGAGKTTLVSQIAGTLKPDAGRVSLGGEDVTALSTHARARRGLKRVFQISSTCETLSALENVILALPKFRSRLFSRFFPALADERLRAPALEALAKVGLAARAETLAGDLAYGERRALELAMALASSPRVLLLDEPMAGVGREESRALTALLATLKGHVPMLLIEHDMAAVFALADRISVLVEGEVILTGAPEAVRADPRVKSAYLGTGAP